MRDHQPGGGGVCPTACRAGFAPKQAAEPDSSVPPGDSVRIPRPLVAMAALSKLSGYQLFSDYQLFEFSSFAC